ncbi:MAG: penicillin-binding protein 2 [Anaerolineae bacterium]|nr:penicillin-binding protein 2 [Anaerolineae bacterium]
MSEKVLPSENFPSWRLWTVYGLMGLIFLYYLFRLFTLQIVQGQDYLDQAEENRTTIVKVQTQRGIIQDRNGFILARNVPSYNVTITPAYLPADEGATQEIYRQLSLIVGVPASLGEINDETVRLFKPCETDLGISQIVFIGDTNAPYDPVRVACNVDREIAMIVQEMNADWAAVDIEIEPVREYPTGELTAEVIGFLGPIPASRQEEYVELGFVPGVDKVGYAGVEASMQDTLSGVNGERTIEVDVAGQEIRDLAPPIDPIPGNNIRLTIDTRLQSAAKAALIAEIDYWNIYFNTIRSSNGVVIAINPKTGEILALVSYPTFENNRMARIIPAYYYEQLSNDPNRPLFNHAISAEHPPGSVFKMATAIGVLNERVVTPEFKVFDPGKITIEQKFSPNDPGTPRDYVCWLDAGHGYVDFLHGVAYSCDVYFYKVSGGYEDEVPVGLGIWRMAEYAKALSYGEITGIELPGEADGLMPDPDWKRRNVGENWATGDTYIAAMGQGYVLSTPLQVLMSFATLANDGKYMKPTLIREIVDSEGNVIQPFTPELKWDITTDPVITIFDENNFATDQKKTVEPWVVELAKQGMRMVVEPGGTADTPFETETIPSAGKTGTAEYCDNVAQSKNLCQPGSWPTHSWYVGYAPYDDPEIAVVAFVYNGGEGASVAAPIVRQVLDAYFELKAIDSTTGTGLGQ